jgi:hypothetical protein
VPKIIKKIEHFIFESSAWKLVFLIVSITIFKTGIWFMPNLDYSQAIAENPFINPFADPNAHYLFWNWLGPFLAWLLGVISKTQFFLFYLFFSITFTLLFIKIAFANFSKELARSSIILFSILPVSATAYFWVGPDSITLFLMLSALAFPQTRIITFAVGVLLGMQHFEQGFFAASGLLFSVFLSQRQGYALRYSVFFCLLFFLGIVVGKIALIGIFKYYAIEVNSGRIYWMIEYFHSLLNQFFFHFHYILWSVLGLGWMVALKFMDLGKKAIPFFSTLMGFLLLLPIVEDQTRVLAIVTFPLISVYWLLNANFLASIRRQHIATIFTLWVLMPWGWTWRGQPKWSVLPYDIAYFLHKTLGWFNVPANPSHWPF